MTKQEARDSSPLIDALDRSGGKSDQQLALELATAQTAFGVLLTLAIICGIISFVSFAIVSAPSNSASVIGLIATLSGAFFLSVAGFAAGPDCTIQRLALDLRTYRAELEERLPVTPPPTQESALAAHPTAAPTTT